MSSFDVEYQSRTECCRPNRSLETAPMHVSRHSIPSKDDVNAMLVQGMAHLSFEELQREQEDLHGVLAIAEKEKKEVDRLLGSFRDHLERLKGGTAYESAESIDKDYVSDKRFQLMFLRRNDYDPKASAEQIISFFNAKLALFGPEKLVKDILLSDLSADDKFDLSRGSYQILRMPDSSGRRIVIEIPSLRAYKSLENELRARFYICMHLTKLPSVANKGVVFLSYCVGQFRDKFNGAGFVDNVRLAMSLPVRVAGLHLCCDDYGESRLAKAAMYLMPPRLKAKTKIHYGSHVECQYLLSTFGIARDSLPLAPMTNDAVLKHHLIWYNQCLQCEHTHGPSCSDPIMNEPNSNDVLFAGRRIDRCGNVMLRSMALQNVQSYSTRNPKERREIVNSMIESIRANNGGRFLKLDPDGFSWNEVALPEVREKIVQMFRNFRRPRASQQKAIMPTSPQMPRKIVDNLRDADILFGRRQQWHLGNQRLRKNVEHKASEYDSATRGRKKQLVEELIDGIKRNGGRFLKRLQDGRFEEVSNATASLRLSSQFRNYRRTFQTRGNQKGIEI